MAAYVILAELQTDVDAVRLARDIVDRAAAAGVALRTLSPVREFTLVFELRSERAA